MMFIPQESDDGKRSEMHDSETGHTAIGVTVAYGDGGTRWRMAWSHARANISCDCRTLALLNKGLLPTMMLIRYYYYYACRCLLYSTRQRQNHSRWSISQFAASRIDPASPVSGTVHQPPDSFAY